MACRSWRVRFTTHPTHLKICVSANLFVCVGVFRFLSMTSTIGYAETFAVFEDFYVRAGVASASRISWIGSVQGFTMLLVMFPAGYLFDLGYCRTVPIFGTIFFVFSWVI